MYHHANKEIGKNSLEGRHGFKSTKKLLVIFIQIITKKEEKPMAAVSAFTEENYHCKPLMTDLIVIHSKWKIK